MFERPAWHVAETSAWLHWWDQAPKDEACSTRVLPSLGEAISYDGAIALAMSEALRGAGNVSPNPLVGAVIVSSRGEFLSAGAHLKVGGPHAEVAAVQAAEGRDLTGATMYVTLEPCAHHGRTPPCAHMLAGLPLQKIVYLSDDPHEKVSGRGVQILRDAGKIVEQSTAWRARGNELVEVFLCNQSKSRVFVGMKVASTRDGLFAGANTSRAWITCQRSREYGHFLRLKYDSILVGPGTVKLDNPTLNVRHSKLRGRTPLRVILDPDGSLAKSGFAFNLLIAEPEKTLWVTCADRAVRDSLGAYGVQTLFLDVDRDGNFQWPEICSHLWSLGVRSLLIEGGAGVWKNALAARAVDKVHWVVSDGVGLTEGISWHPPQQVVEASDNAPKVTLDKDRYVEFCL